METSRKWILLLALSCLLSKAFAVPEDTECTEYNHGTYQKTGRCIDTSDCFQNVYLSNKCPAYGNSIKCCFAATHACDSYYHPTYGITGKCGSVSSCNGPNGGSSGGYVSGKCPGNSQQVCCFTGGSDSQCVTYNHATYGKVGYCTHTSSCPGNNYISNLCPTAPANVKCCFSIPDPCNEYTTITRSQWNANAPTGTVGTISSAVEYVFIHHTAGNECYDTAECSTLVKGIQNYHQNSRGYSDIGYSFLVGSDGQIYEGRGWGKEGAHTQGYNSVGYAFSFLGTFTNKLPTPAALKAAQNAIACGVKLGHIQSDYTLRGHRDMGSTSCPGDLFYNKVVKKWPNY